MWMWLRAPPSFSFNYAGIVVETFALLLFPKYSRQITSILATVDLKMFSHELKEVTHKLNVRLGQVNCPEENVWNPDQ